MAKIALIGWYGTETIGDRAILSGLFDVLGRVFEDCEIALGSLYPLLTERTVSEDRKFWDSCFGHCRFDVHIFNSREVMTLNREIRYADYVVLGGGPLMDIDEMYMIEYAFRQAKRYNKKNWILGSGWGPLKKNTYIQSALNIVQLADICILRDFVSFIEIQRRVPKFAQHAAVAGDPAILAANIFRQMHPNKSIPEDFIAVNFRAASSHYNLPSDFDSIAYFSGILDSLRQYNMPILLVPMHTFSVGDDDRFILNNLAKRFDEGLISVQNEVISLEDTMSIYFRAKLLVGMRFHSVLLQTILNGRNYIVDYTDMKNGKIIGLIKLLNIQDQLSGRYISLERNSDSLSWDLNIPPFHIDEDLIPKIRAVYLEKIRSDL